MLVSLLDFLEIVLINVSLSSDNVIVIGMAAASLAQEQRKWALIFGGGLAILLRVSLTSGASFLMTLPLLSAAGGLFLIWVAYRLLKLEVEESGKEKRAKSVSNLFQAVVFIAMSDLVMSLDNILAVAGAARGNLVPLVAGLLFSMSILMVVGGLVARLIERFAWLSSLGAAVICFTAVRMIFEDEFVAARFPVPSPLGIIIAAIVGIVFTLLILMLNKRKKRETPPH